jgi:hypothetical protein
MAELKNVTRQQIVNARDVTNIILISPSVQLLLFHH